MVIVYGPQGCGKTRNAEFLREKFGMRFVVDGWSPNKLGRGNAALMLTNASEAQILKRWSAHTNTIISYEKAMSQ